MPNQRGTQCQMCRSADEERDWAIVAGLRSFEEMATLLDSSKSVIDRHLNHIEIKPERARAFRTWLAQRRAKAPGAALERRLTGRLDESAEALAPSPGQVFHRLYELEGAALKLLARADAEGQIRDGISAIRACEALVTRAAELAGLLRTGTNIAVGVVVADDASFDQQVNDLIAAITQQASPACARCGESCSACASEALPMGSLEDLQRRKASLARDRGPGGVVDAEVVEEAPDVSEAHRTPPTPPRPKALPAPPHEDACRCWKCADKPAPHRDNLIDGLVKRSEW